MGGQCDLSSGRRRQSASDVQDVQDVQDVAGRCRMFWLSPCSSGEDGGYKVVVRIVVVNAEKEKPWVQDSFSERQIVRSPLQSSIISIRKGSKSGVSADFRGVCGGVISGAQLSSASRRSAIPIQAVDAEIRGEFQSLFVTDC